MNKKEKVIVIAVVVMLAFLGVQPFLSTYYVTETVIETESDYYYVEPSYTGEPEPSPPTGGGGGAVVSGNISSRGFLDDLIGAQSAVVDIVIALTLVGMILAMFYAIASVTRRAVGRAWVASVDQNEMVDTVLALGIVAGVVSMFYGIASTIRRAIK